MGVEIEEFLNECVLFRDGACPRGLTFRVGLKTAWAFLFAEKVKKV